MRRMRPRDRLPLVVAIVLVPFWLQSRAAHPSSPALPTPASSAIVAPALAPPTGTPYPTLATCYYRQLELATPESREMLTAMLAVAEPPDAMWNAQTC